MAVNIPNNNQKAQVIIRTLAHKVLGFDSVSFFPYDFEFDDQYKPEWGNYEGFGRMDPIMTYKRTTRDISLSFNVVAENQQQAKDNFDKLQFLITWLYPAYNNSEDELSALNTKKAEIRKKLQKLTPGPITSTSDMSLANEEAKIDKQITNFQQTIENVGIYGEQVIKKSPLFRISFMNLLNEEDYVIAITNFKHKMKFDAADTTFSKDGKVIPGEFSINMSFKVLHTYPPGISATTVYP